MSTRIFRADFSTSMVQWFCCFREGVEHAGDNGKLRVLQSDDGIAWTAPRKIFNEGEWLWRVDWHEGRAYGISYPYKRAEHPDPKVAEATVRVRPSGEMIALVRRERGTYFGWIGVSQPPYQEWTRHETAHRFGGPNFIVLPDGSLIAAGRSYRAPFSTVFATMDPTHYEIGLILPSGGSDTGYPGMVWHEGELWVSYYSSHEDKDGNPPLNRHTELPTAIYTARVKLE